jgi:hypothetical protein
MPGTVDAAGCEDILVSIMGVFSVSLIEVTIECPRVGDEPPATAIILDMIKKIR